MGECCKGVMTSPANKLAHIHDRSPVILGPAERDTWLNAPFAGLSEFDRRYPANRMLVEATAKP